MLSAGAKTDPNGFFLDGENPTPHPVRISLLDTSLRFLPIDERKPQLWEFAVIDWEATRLANDQLRLKQRDNDQWLVITDAALIAEVQAERKHWTRRNFWSARPDTGMALRAGLGAVVLCVTLWLSWPLLTKPAARLVPQSTRTWLGDSAQQMMGMSTVCTEPEGQAALDRLTQRLTTQHPELENVRVVPVQSSMINALTLANDKVLLTSAIIAQANSPDEIAGILAHEFGHVAHMHVLRGFLGQALMKLLIAIFTGVHGDEIGYINTVTNNAHVRKFESEADMTGIQLLRDANIATQGLGEFFNRIARQEGAGGRFLKYFNTHPPSAEREQLMRDTAVPGATPAMTANDWQALKRACPTSSPRLKQAPPEPEDEAESLPAPLQNVPAEEPRELRPPVPTDQEEL